MQLKNYKERMSAIPEETKASVRMRNEIYRLTELVQAQKELIELHDKLAESDFLTKKEWMRIDVLRNKIKELDQ